MNNTVPVVVTPIQPSTKWSLNQAEFRAFFHNAVIFLAPVALTELTLLGQGNLNVHTYLTAFEVWAIGVSIDFFRKAKQEKPPVPPGGTGA